MSEKVKHFYFMGICGTAMGSAAVALKERGYRVTGSDASVYPPMSTFLTGHGIELKEGYKEEHVPDDADYIVVGNAMSRGNPEVERVLNSKLRYLSLPELLKEFFLRGKRNFVVSGTHGKTTTSSLLAWLLEHAGLQPGFMIGGIPRNFGEGARLMDSDFVVMEGDEYDTAFFDKRSKFLHYLPEFVVVNNIEFDHADIFDSIEDIKLSFKRMLNIVPSNGLVCVNGDDANCLEVAEHCPAPVRTVGMGETCDVRIVQVEYRGGESAFVIEGEAYVIGMDGEYNVRNAAMAVCGARFAGVEPAVIREGLLGFKGIARRQEIRGVTESGITVVDDFAHHPTAIREALKGMRRRFEGARLWAVFEPRSNTTRRNVFQQELPDALSEADAVCVCAVEDPGKVAMEDRLDPERVMATLKEKGLPAFYEAGADAIVERLKSESREGDVVIVLSNGGFGGIHEKLLQAL
ncbi:MAG: UDP-N-acetylmuramate:L-alanyl-gamma-D-glutamyl-meso-diaminopimelate ligase [Verrucomicrobiales bacterium]|nr:UDP-N-acetylmuramate:L-alanyl-gamma-D-glutamyl-meso-diaminopimelate ligase [Verrucomicrobiales bacterium]